MSKKELNPIMTDAENSQISSEDLKQIAQNLQDTTIIETEQEETSDTYFRAVLDKLFSVTNVSSKTEYLNVKENFAGSKVEFFSSYGNMPYLKKFIEIFEIKRISLERKGRKEILLGLQERRQEIEQQRIENMRSMFNV